MTAIEWTDKTWNPIVGCSRVSKGCEHCYAERTAHRGMAPQHKGLTVLGQHGPRWTGEVRFVESRLSDPLHWRKPQRVFVNSMSDLFHAALAPEQIAAIFGVMAACPHLTFQVLTKRPAKMREWFAWAAQLATSYQPLGTAYACAAISTNGYRSSALTSRRGGWPGAPHCVPWPLPNVWLGVTAEDQAAADERIPLLLDTPAAVRFVSYEPALGPIDFTKGTTRPLVSGEEFIPWLPECEQDDAIGGGVDWIIVGGESGPKARPFDLAWARSVIAQGRVAGVPVFVKQLGARPSTWGDRDYGYRRYPLRDRKGKDPSEWPEDLRVRELPQVRRA